MVIKYIQEIAHNVSKAFLSCVPQLHCPEEDAERYQESDPSESNYGHGLLTNENLSIDLEIKGTSPKLYCPEEDAERYQESDPSESNYGHGLLTNENLSIDLEIKGTSPKLQLQCPEEESYQDPVFDLKGRGNFVLIVYDHDTRNETRKLHHFEEEDAEQLKRKTECKEEMTVSKEVESKFKNEGSDEIQNCPVSSSKQEMVITKSLKGENGCNEKTVVAKQLKGKKEVANQLNQVKEKIEDNDAEETMNYYGKRCPMEMTRGKEFEGKNEQNEDMGKAKEEEEENECNAEMDVAKQIKEGRKTNTCHDIDNGKMTKIKQTKCKNKCSGEMTVAKHFVGRKKEKKEMSFGKKIKKNIENNNVNEIENCNSKSYKNSEGEKHINEKSKSTEKTAVLKTEDKNEEKLANEIQIPINTCYNPNDPEAKQLNEKNECDEEISVAKQEKIGEMNLADDMKYCHSTRYNNQSVESKQMDGNIECDEGKTTAKLEYKMADAMNTFHGTCSKEEMAVENQSEEKNKCSEEVANHGGKEMDVAKQFKEKRKEKIVKVKQTIGNNKCNNEFEVANQVREKIKNKDGDEIMNCHSPSFDKETAEAMQLKTKMKWNEEKQFGGKNECNKEGAICKQMDEVSECGKDMNIAKQGKGESKGEINEVKKIKENDKCYEEMTVPKSMESKKEQPVLKEIFGSKQEEKIRKKVTVKTKRRTNEDNETQPVIKMLREKNKVKKAVEMKRSCYSFNEEKSTAMKTKEKKDVKVFNAKENDYAETTKESKGKKENTFDAKQPNVKKGDQVEDVRKRNDAQIKRMTLAKHRERGISSHFGHWLKFFSVLANPFLHVLIILVCLAGGANASGDDYLKTQEVLNASDPFIGLDRCSIELDKLQCNHQEIKSCIPYVIGSMLVVCTGNFNLIDYACPVVTKTKEGNLWIQTFEQKCNSCREYETIKERLQRENNTVGEECLRIYADNRGSSKVNITNNEEDKTSLDGVIVAPIVVVIVVIIAIILIIVCWCPKRCDKNRNSGSYGDVRSTPSQTD